METISLIAGIVIGALFTFLGLRNRSKEVTPREIEVELAQLREKAKSLDSLKNELNQEINKAQNATNELARVEVQFQEKQKGGSSRANQEWRAPC